MTWNRSVLAACVLLLTTCGGNKPPLVVATTTSVAQSGLLDAVLPSFEEPVRVLQVGSGRAMALLSSNGAAAAITHAPEQEAQVLRQHPLWFYRKILYNDFLIVGPVDDPSNIAGATDAAEAMKRLIQSGQRFISRGDESGTHERERQLWMAVGIDAQHTQIVVAGAGMGQTLRIASETNSYTLTDRGTFEMTSPSGLRELVAGDPRLLNTYAVIADPRYEAGIRFAQWLAQGKGREALAAVLTSGKVKGFTPWPPGHDGTRPDSRPF